MVDDFYAHTDASHPDLPPENGGRWHGLREHLESTAALAATFASSFNAHHWGYLAGLWHDAGKYSKEFQTKLRASTNAHIEAGSKVDHSTYGAQRAKEKWETGEGKLLAYIIAGHHAGLPDGKSNEPSCLFERLSKKLPYSFHCPEELFEQTKPVLPFSLNKERSCIQLSLFIRMLYSCLVDADFLDTEKHMNPKHAAIRRATLSLSALKHRLDQHLKEVEATAPNTLVNRIRAGVLKDCRHAAFQPPGLFSLTVPTGGGKTLSSMAFALDHAEYHKRDRVVYVLPYTSIIEQNAEVFRKALGNEVVLEHHSNFELEEEDYRTRLASENWNAPVVVTTNVQFFESLFANRSSRCRKLHNIANSIIILDEVQTLPARLLLPCLEILRELTTSYGATIVLCSATQPALQKRRDFNKGLENVREIATDPEELQLALKRVNVRYLGKQTDAELIQQLDREQILCIVNTRKHAKLLFDVLKEKGDTFHLSTLMYPSHRSRQIAKIRQRLYNKQPCRVVSTQLVEAGVDIDFPVVYREIAGIDSIAQAAGRCNREGHLTNGDVYVFEPEGGLPPGTLTQTAQTAQSVIRRFAPDFMSLEAIEEYFKDYYWLKGHEGLDALDIIARLKEGIKDLNFPFAEIAQTFRLIEDPTRPIIVAIEDEAQKLVAELRYADHLQDYARRLQRYTVRVHCRDWQELYAKGAILTIHDLFPVLQLNQLYHDETGLEIFDKNVSPECFIV